MGSALLCNPGWPQPSADPTAFLLCTRRASRCLAGLRGQRPEAASQPAMHCCFVGCPAAVAATASVSVAGAARARCLLAQQLGCR